MVVELLAPVALAPGVVDAAPPDRALEARLRRHVGLGADDRRDAPGAALLVEVEDAVHVAVVGDRERRLAVGDRGRDEIADPSRSVEHRVLGVGVQMDERIPRCVLCPRSPRPLLAHSLSTGSIHSLWTNYKPVISPTAR